MHDEIEIVNGGVSRAEAPMCGELEVCPSWENNTIVRRGERRVGESCDDRAKVPDNETEERTICVTT